MQADTTLCNPARTDTMLLLARVGTGEAYDTLAAAATLAATTLTGVETSEFPLVLPFAQPMADDAKGSEKDEDEDEEGEFGEEEGDDEDDEFEDEDEFEDDEDEFFGDDADDDEFDDDADDEDDEDEDF